MIERYTIKVSPALSQKEIERALRGTSPPEQVAQVHLVKARIEFLAAFPTLQKIVAYMEEHSKKIHD